MLRSLKAFTFALTVDDASLNDLPLHLTRLVSLQTSPPAGTGNGRSGQPAPARRASNSSGGFAFDSFLKSFELGFDSFVSQVDQLMSTTIVIPESITNPLKEAASSLNNDGDQYVARKPSVFFKSSLKTLLCDEFRCTHAYLDAALGIPTQAIKMLHFISTHANAPQLFRHRPAAHAVEDFKRLVENEANTFAPTTDVNVVAFVLLQWLTQLPEPLLGYDHYYAILACQELEDTSERIRNLAILINDTPWYHKPLLARVLALFQRCLQPENTTTNHLNVIAISLLATPLLLRPPPSDTDFYSTSDVDALQMAVTASGSTIVEFLLAHVDEILQPLHEELSERQRLLSEKCERIHQWQEDLTKPVDLLLSVPASSPASSSLNASTNSLDSNSARTAAALKAEARSLAVPSTSSTATDSVSNGASARLAEQETLVRELWVALGHVDRHFVAALQSSTSHAPVDAMSSLLESSQKATDSADVSLLEEIAAFEAAEQRRDPMKRKEGEKEERKEGIVYGDVLHDHAAKTADVHAVAQLSLAQLLADERWQRCAFTLNRVALQDLQAPLGFVTLRCLVRFLQMYQEKAVQMALDFAQSRRRFCSLPQVCTNGMHV